MRFVSGLTGLKGWKSWAGSLLIIGLGLFFFGLALWPIHRVTGILPQYVGLEQGENGVKFGWLKPDALFHLEDVPLYAPIYVHFTLALNRPEDAPPAVLQVIESTNDIGGPERVLATYEGRNTPTGWQEYLLKIPPSETSSEDLFLYFRSNAFQAKGDSRTLGVAIADISFETKPAGLLYLLSPRPYLLAVLILLVGMATWCKLLQFGTIESGMLLAAVGFGSGVMANILAYWCWYLLVVAFLIVACAFWWRRFLHSAPTPLLWLPLFAALVLFSAFFVPAPGLVGDIFYWRQFIEQILRYGPIDIYPNVLKLVYPPGAVFFLWGYGLLTQPFGLTYSQVSLKAVMGVAHFGLLAILWYTGYRTNVPMLARARALLLFGFSLSLVFVPLVWVQADAWLTLLMLVPVLLVVWQRPYLSAGVQALAFLYKPQSWLLLPLYSLVYLWRGGWRRALLGGALTIGLIGLIGGVGFAFDPARFWNFWQRPGVSGESGWGGIRTFNLLHALGYDQKEVAQPWLWLSYGLLGVSYLAVLLMMWWRKRSFDQPGAKAQRERLYLTDWLLAAGLILTLAFFLWVRMHERYLYFGLAFLPFAALWRRDLYKPIAFFNFWFILNLLYAYLPERRDEVPNNFLFWRHALHAVWFQNGLVVIGLLGCGWLAWLYFRKVISYKL